MQKTIILFPHTVNAVSFMWNDNIRSHKGASTYLLTKACRQLSYHGSHLIQSLAYITTTIVGSHVSPKVPSPNINGVFCSAIIIKNHCLSTLSLRATYVKTHLNFGRNYYWHSYYLSSTKLSLSVRRLQRASYILVFFLIDKSIILYFFTKNQVLFFQNSINCVRCNGIFI